MTSSEIDISKTPFSSESACVAYLFKKRWPTGFKCPFCNTVQNEIAPAYVVVCRYCRKQTSITAHTLMHGSKKSLVAWMQVAWQFCFQDQGTSARELQRLMELSCYQTAWNWLQKIRRGAALAESAPCCGIVLFDLALLPTTPLSKRLRPDIGMALELNSSKADNARVRFTALTSRSPETITTAINNLIKRETTLLIRDQEWLSSGCRIAPDLRGKPTKEQLKRGQLLLQQTETWMNTVYRGAIDPSLLQGYLDEFSFRYNTASWSDQLLVLDHLLTGLVSTVKKTAKDDPPVISGGIS